MSNFSTTVMGVGAKAVAFTAAFGLILAFVPVLSLVAVPLLPIPVALLTKKHGLAPGVAATLAAAALCALLAGALGGLFVFLLAALVGVGTGWGLKSGFSQLKLFVVAALLFSLSLASWTAALLVGAGVGPLEAFQALTDQTLALARDAYPALGFTEDQIDQTLAEVNELAAPLPYLAPAALFVLSIMLSGANLALARRIFARLGEPFPQDWSFGEFRLHFAFAYLMILGLAMEFLAPFVSEDFSSFLSLAGMNLVIIAEALFFIQGLAIASYFLGRYKVSRVKRTGVYICLVLLQLTLSLTSWLGLFDTWLDYRHRFNKKTSQPRRLG